MKKDIETRADIELLIRNFYTKVLTDDTIGFIFTEIAKIDLEAHLPHLFDFWDNILLGANGYKRNVMKAHLDLNAKAPLEAKHFERWLSLFTEAVDAQFEGPTANAAKNKALSIATVIQVKIHQPKLL